MTESGIHAADNDVEALILGDAFANDDESCITDAVGREVTMRGDLQQMPLADVFQSLGMSKMEGVLRVRNLVEQREIYFRDGLVRMYVPVRTELRRLGIQLVQGGLMTPEALRAILFEQKKSRRPLRDLLIEHRVLPEAEVDELFAHRAAEELYGLFTWTQGTFEFYKGPPTDPVVLARFEELKAFDTNAVLMEVARRSDEWEVIIEAIGSVDEIVVAVEGAEHEVKGDELEVLRALDGRRTIRMLAPSMLFGLFELSRIVRTLLEGGQARFATVEEALDAARQFLAHGSKKLTCALLETLAARTTPHTYEELHAIAKLFQEAGEQRRAAATLLSAAREADSPETALEMLHDARALAPRSCEVLEQLRDCLLRIDDPERDGELHQVTDELCTALIEDGRLEDALAMLEQLEAAAPGDARLAFRRAIVLHRLGRRDEAVAGLLELANQFRAARQRDQLTVVYEQILKIDPRRRDVSRALRTLRATAMVRRLRLAALIVVAFGVGVGGVVSWRNQQREWLLGSATDAVTRALQAGDVASAEKTVADAERQIGDPEMTRPLHAMIESWHAARREEAARAQAARVRARLAEAAAHFERGDLEAAVQTYAAMLPEADAAQRAELFSVVRARFQSLLPDLERLARELPYALPPAPGPTIDGQARRQAIADLQNEFRDADLLRARACMRAMEHELCGAALDQDTSERLTKACTEIVRTFGIADVRRTAYQSLEQVAEVGRRLQPVVIEAREHEAQHRYAEAARAYQRLVTEHPHEDDLKAQFRASLARAQKIADGLAAVAAATTAQDAPRAWQAMRALQREYPDVPIPRLVRLPLALESEPSGADVFLGDQKVGTTPLRLTFVPAFHPEVRIQLDGFAPETRQVSGDERGAYRVVLTKQPEWTATLRGAVTQAPGTDGRRLVFAVDRAGHTTALALETGRRLWSVASPPSDLSGLLPHPVVVGDLVIVGSVDGTVRGLSASDGALRWQRSDVPIEAAPLLHGELWVAGTTDRRLVALHGATGEPRYDLPLAHAPVGLVSDGRTVCCTLANGDVLGFDPRTGKQTWFTPTEQVVAVRPALSGGTLFVLGDDGRVTALACEGGATRWRREVGVPAQVMPVVDGDRVLVATADGVLALAAATGEEVARYPTEEAVTSLGIAGRSILVGTEPGVVHCFDRRGGKELLRLRGPGRISAPPLVLGDWVVVGFEDRALHAYRRLP